MDGRKRFSGAQYKKSAEVKKRKFNKIIKKLQNFLLFLTLKIIQAQVLQLVPRKQRPVVFIQLYLHLQLTVM